MEKYLTFREFQLNEIGDASAKPFKWKQIYDQWGNRYYDAKSPKSGLTYEIWFSSDSDSEDIGGDHSLSFTLEENDIRKYLSEHPDFEGGAYSIVTNTGDMFGLMSTIVEIVIDFVKKYEPDSIMFMGAVSKGESADSHVLTKRNKLYLAFIDKNLKKYFPKAKVNIKQNTVQIKFK